MKKKKNEFLQSYAHDSLWDQVDRIIQSMSSPAEVDEGELWSMTFDNEAVDQRDRTAFWHAVSKDFSPSNHSTHGSLIERWVQEHRRTHWLARMRERLSHLESISETWKTQVEPLFSPLENVLAVLGERMVLAPAHRSASLNKERVYQPRRRAIEPADLPGFNPLFCTAVAPNSGPISLSGLSVNTAYRFLVLDSQDRDNFYEQTQMASEEGKLQIDLPTLLAALQSKSGELRDCVWFLEENGETPQGSWTSGLVWLENESTHSKSQQAEKIIKKSAASDSIEFSIDTLFDINLLTVRQYYIQAYEKARQSLLFTPKSYKEENQIPFKESLWQFIQLQINEIVHRLEQAEVAFRQIRPQWKAVESLRALQKRLTEWD